MKNKLLKIFDTYSKRKAGYIPLHEREELANEIIECTKIASADNVDWAGLDPVKWKDVKPSRKYVVFGDAEDITITPQEK